jgi:XTP/dITP diphosphohydrolase
MAEEMNIMKQILIATHNPGKIIEYKMILRDLPLKLLMLSDFGSSAEPEEDGANFEENAIKKAEFYSAIFDLPILAEDSGLEIDYLNGEPGVHSRRWPTLAEAATGKPSSKKSDEELVEMALQKLRGVPYEQRTAQFRVVIAYKPSRQEDAITAEGILRGCILEKPASPIIPGFPFRSLFYVPELEKTLGELNMQEEAKIAHRRKAVEKLKLLILPSDR